jgi:S-adenosylmethionine hydrolase
MLKKTQTLKVIAINAFGEAIISIPEDFAKELNWKLHDEFDIEVIHDKVLIIKKTDDIHQKISLDKTV